MSDGKKLYGQTYDAKRNLFLPFVDREYDYRDDASNVAGGVRDRKTGLEGTAGADQSPTDEAAAKVRLYDIAAIQAAAVALTTEVLPAKVRVSSLPDVLYGVKVTFNGSNGAGASNYPTANQQLLINTAGSGGLDPTASAQGSASIVPNVFADVRPFGNRLVNATNYYFYAVAPVTVTNVLTKVIAAGATGCIDLPNFKPRVVKLAINGGQVSVQQTASSDARLAVGTDSSSVSYRWGDQYSKEVGVSSRVETIPETVHAAITISGNTSTKDVTVTVAASTVALPSTGSPVVAAITNTPTAITATANASVKTEDDSNTIAATTPTNVPRTGLYLVDIDGQLDEYGLVAIRATVVDFLQYAD